MTSGIQAPRLAILQFPASNCDQDCVHAVRSMGARARMVWHKETSLGDVDAVIVPGGFSYGDALRCGAIARFSPVMRAVAAHAAAGGLVLGICNGFQVLAEAGLVPGVLRRNATLRFEHGWVRLSVERRDTPFTAAVPAGRTLRMPIAHGEGSYFLPDDELAALEARGGVLFRYAPPEGNPNGSRNDIAGVIDAGGRVCGLMPHPERLIDPLVGGTDGRALFESLAHAA